MILLLLSIEFISTIRNREKPERNRNKWKIKNELRNRSEKWTDRLEERTKNEEKLKKTPRKVD